MDALEAIFSRRSIRKYTNEQVSDELIEKLLRAGMQAPSTRNQQSWHYIVVRDRKLLNKITTVHPHSQMLKEASAAIIVCGDENLASYKLSWVSDCAAATENILISATALGLGAVWLGVYLRDERIIPLKELFVLRFQSL